MAYLIQTTEVYRASTSKEAATLIEEAKKTSTLAKYDCIKKEKKSKGEVVDEWFKVTLTKKWDDEKEPSGNTVVLYQEGAF